MQKEGYDTHWYDPRKDLATINEIHLVGVLVNITKKRPIIFNPWSKHWYPIRPINGQWWNLDSKLDSAQPIDDFLSYLRTVLQIPQTQLILITPPNVSTEELYSGSSERDSACQK